MFYARHDILFLIMPKRLECRIFGRVQFVMFRDFAARKARNLGLAGTVENMSDGSVFVVAEGEDRDLEKLFFYLKKGPIFARVERIEPKWLAATGEFSDFKILFYGKQD